MKAHEAAPAGTAPTMRATYRDGDPGRTDFRSVAGLQRLQHLKFREQPTPKPAHSSIACIQYGGTLVMNKTTLLAAAAILTLPSVAHSQSSSWFGSAGPTYPGFYIGAQGGLNWLLNNQSYVMDTGWTAGGKVGYDFVGPRVELDGRLGYHAKIFRTVTVQHAGQPRRHELMHRRRPRAHDERPVQ